MKINLHIERLVLEGLPLERVQGRLVQAAVERELALLIATNGLADDLQAGSAAPERHAADIRVANESHPTQLGQQIAQSVYSGMGRTR
jgi:hypothetical protein